MASTRRQSRPSMGTQNPQQSQNRASTEPSNQQLTLDEALVGVARRSGRLAARHWSDESAERWQERCLPIILPVLRGDAEEMEEARVLMQTGVGRHLSVGVDETLPAEDAEALPAEDDDNPGAEDSETLPADGDEQPPRDDASLTEDSLYADPPQHHQRFRPDCEGPHDPGYAPRDGLLLLAEAAKVVENSPASSSPSLTPDSSSVRPSSSSSLEPAPVQLSPIAGPVQPAADPSNRFGLIDQGGSSRRQANRWVSTVTGFAWDEPVPLDEQERPSKQDAMSIGASQPHHTWYAGKPAGRYFSRRGLLTPTAEDLLMERNWLDGLTKHKFHEETQRLIMAKTEKRARKPTLKRALNEEQGEAEKAGKAKKKAPKRRRA